MMTFGGFTLAKDKDTVEMMAKQMIVLFAALLFCWLVVFMIFISRAINSGRNVYVQATPMFILLLRTKKLNMQKMLEIKGDNLSCGYTAFDR